MQHTLRQLSAQAVEPLDFSDDRLSHLLKHPLASFPETGRHEAAAPANP